MKVIEGRWELKNGLVAEIRRGPDGYYALVENAHLVERHDYNEYGECYRAVLILIKDANLIQASKVGDEMLRTESESMKARLSSWDLHHFLGFDISDSQIESIKRSSNPILNLDLCTE